MNQVSQIRSTSSAVSSLEIHPARIRITNLRLRTYIGFNPEEVEKQQDVIINAIIDYRADEACMSDDKNDALNYKLITKAMIRHVEEGRFKLLEKLTQDLLDITMSSEDVCFAEVTVDKPHALRFADSVSITRAASRRNS